MKKVMIADLIKQSYDEFKDSRDLAILDLLNQFNITEDDATKIVDNYNDPDTQYLIAKAMEEFDLNLGNAEIFVDDYPNESDWAQVADAAEALGVDITDITPDDVEAMNDGGGAKGMIDSSMGIIKYIYNHKAQAYSILLLVDGNPLMYNNIKPYMMNEMINAESFGSHYNDNLRGNDLYEGCGCKANFCDSTDLAIFSSIS